MLINDILITLQESSIKSANLFLKCVARDVPVGVFISVYLSIDEL
jgi:hypothetical protein